MTGRSIRLTLERLRGSELTLAERNRALESEMAARRQMETERNSLFELSLDLLAVLDSAGTFRRLNPAFEATLGYPEAEFVGKSLGDFVHPNDQALLRDALRRLADGQAITHFECRFVRQDGEARLLSWSARPVEGVVYAVARDITERVEAQKSQMELAVAIEKANFLTEFLATVSHDIKNPLTVINTSLYLLERVDNPAKQRDRLDDIRQQALIVERLVQDILTVSRLDYQPGLKLDTFDLSPLLRKIVERLSPRAVEHHIELQLDLAKGLPPALADNDQIERAFTNLIENALNYTPDGGRVDVRASAEAGKLAVSVADTGIGIEEKDLAHVFERFYRSDAARSLQKGGSGLGLAIVKKILDLHQGHIEVSSAPGLGTTFRVELPVGAAVAAAS
jgi:PAS domain S-box-containing protein